MPRIDDTILHCSIYLYVSEDDAKAGTPWGGSGFLVGVPFTTDKDSYHIYAVTASHVIETDATVIRFNARTGIQTIPYVSRDWVSHRSGDDIAVALTDLNPDPSDYRYKFEFIYAAENLCVTKTLQDEIALGPGDDVFMIGRFVGRDERQSNIPLTRFGHIAGPKNEPINQGPERRNFIQDSFLVEVHSLPGFSGSPVFVSIPSERIPKGRKDEYSYPKQIYLLGVDWGTLDENKFPGMSGVVPAWKLLELLYDDKEVVQMRKEREKELAERSEVSHGRIHANTEETRQTLAKKVRDRIDIPIPDKGQFDNDLSKTIRKRKD
jgi:hypothetical protein